jgi:ATP-dependent DNA helicase RecG
MRIEAVADDGTGAVRVVWHNRYPSFAKSARGRRAALYATPEPGSKGEMRLENPETELFDDTEDADPVHTGRIVGVYHRVGDVAPRVWRTLVRRTLDALEPRFAAASSPPDRLRAALETAHFPDHVDAAKAAVWQLAREELTVLAARIEDRRAAAAGEARHRAAGRGGDQAARAVRAAVPADGAQKRAVREIADDLASGRAMARLLQGDVGSGKTVVAGLAVLIASQNGAQAALMAPTEILAEQHAESLSAWLTAAGVRMGLLTGRVRGPARRRLLDALAAGSSTCSSARTP